jgi:hypothetical protein
LTASRCCSIFVLRIIKETAGLFAFAEAFPLVDPIPRAPEIEAVARAAKAPEKFVDPRVTH